MKRIVFGIFGTLSAVALLFSYKTSLEVVVPAAAAEPTGGSAASATKPAPTPTQAPTPASTPGNAAGQSTSDGSASSGDASGTASSAPAPTPAGTYTGGAVDTRYGPVQVAVTISGGRITDVQVPQYPAADRRDQEINSQAVPILISETTEAQSAQIQMVSGATYTSEGYVRSLQSALDQAGAQ